MILCVCSHKTQVWNTEEPIEDLSESWHSCVCVCVCVCVCNRGGRVVFRPTRFRTACLLSLCVSASSFRFSRRSIDFHLPVSTLSFSLAGAADPLSLFIRLRIFLRQPMSLFRHMLQQSRRHNSQKKAKVCQPFTELNPIKSQHNILLDLISAELMYRRLCRSVTSFFRGQRTAVCPTDVLISSDVRCEATRFHFGRIFSLI